jgi:hypothetical protein
LFTRKPNEKKSFGVLSVIVYFIPLSTLCFNIIERLYCGSTATYFNNIFETTKSICFRGICRYTPLSIKNRRDINLILCSFFGILLLTLPSDVVFHNARIISIGRRFNKLAFHPATICHVRRQAILYTSSERYMVTFIWVIFL